jgi:flagellar biosynthesis protein FlhF
MKIKTFYAKSMANAMQEIKTSLGPEALILSTKEIPNRSGSGRAPSGFEVVAACDDSTGTDRALLSVDAGMEEPAAATSGVTSPEPMVYSPSSLLKNHARPAKRQPARKKSICHKSPGAPKLTVTTASEELPFTGVLSIGIYNDLVASGVHEWLARRLVQEAQEAFGLKQRRTRPALMRAVSQMALKQIAVPPPQEGLPGKRVVVLFGPTGVGKTTSIAKLAAMLALRNRKKVALMTLDGYRIGAVEQLRTYAGLMGIPFRFVGRVADLPAEIAENGQRDYILIDTTGRGPKDIDAMQDLAILLNKSADVERHLVLSATTKTSDLDAIVDRFAICRPDHLIFTKLDETATLGPILNQLVRSGKSLSYYTDGQRVPEDLHTVQQEQLIDIVLNNKE